MKRGRPPKPEGEAKEVRFNFRLREDELSRFRKAAKAMRLDLSEWIRNTLANSLAGKS